MVLLYLVILLLSPSIIGLKPSMCPLHLVSHWGASRNLPFELRSGFLGLGELEHWPEILRKEPVPKKIILSMLGLGELMCILCEIWIRQEKAAMERDGI